MANTWFRLYNDIVNDPKIKMLAFEDRWHYVAILVFKNMGEMDKPRKEGLFERLLAVHLGLNITELDSLKKRLMDVDLIDDTFQPKNWDKRQYKTDSSTERVRKHRAKSKGCKDVTPMKRYSNVSVTAPDTDTDTETEKDIASDCESDAAASPAKIVEAWHEKMTDLPRIRQITPGLRKHINARLAEKVERHDIAWWRDLFVYCRQCPFLMGQTKPPPGRKPFVLTLRWLVKPENFAKVIEGNYEEPKSEVA